MIHTAPATPVEELRAHVAHNFARPKALLHEDRGCVGRVYRGLCAMLSALGPLSHLERPHHDFAPCIAG